MYALEWHPQVRGHLRAVPPNLARAISANILDLQDDPYPPRTEELRDHYAGIWKIKVDGWCILYMVDESRQIVTIFGVRRRTRNTYNSMYD